MLTQQGETYPLDQIYFYLSDGCNLRCRHCWIAPKFQKDNKSGQTLPFDLFKDIVIQGQELGLSGVKLTGGEPLLHPDFEKIVTFANSEGLELTVETNGTLCTDEIAQAMAANCNPLVSVSLDGAKAQTHDWVRNVPGSFDQALEGTHKLVAAGISPQIIMSIMRCNKDEVGSLVRLAESLGAESVKLNLIQPTARGSAIHESGDALAITELIDLGKWVEKDLAPVVSLPVYYDHPDAFRPMGSLFGADGDGCAACGVLGIIGVLADGTYALCGIGTTVSELVFGHATEDRLAKVWQETSVLQQIRQGLPRRLEGVCGDCLMREYCLGSCIAQNYYRKGSLWAPFWFCEQADVAGFFPETRRQSTYLAAASTHKKMGFRHE